MAPKYIPLFSNPPDSPHRPHDGSDDIESDFEPIRIHETTPEPSTPPTKLHKPPRLRQKCRSSPSESEQSPSSLPRLGAKNIVNTLQVIVNQAKDVPKSLLKRKLEPLGNDHPSKRQHFWDDDMDWLEQEIDGLKERMSQMDKKLDGILHEVHQFNDI